MMKTKLIPKSNYEEVLSNVFKKYFNNKRLINIKNEIQSNSLLSFLLTLHIL